MNQVLEKTSSQKFIHQYKKKNGNYSLGKEGISSRSLSKIISPQLKIYNRNVFLREAYKNMIQQNHQQQIKELANTEKLNHSSYKILKDKIQASIDQIIQKICKNNDSDHLQAINFDQMCDVIFQLNEYLRKNQRSLQLQQFLSQLWLYLKCYDIQNQYLDSFTLATFMKILMDPKISKPLQIKQILSHIQGFKNSSELKKDFLDKFPDLADQALQDVEIFKLWFTIRQKYNLFYKHQDSSQRINKYNNHMTFRPQISQNSRIYAQKSLKKYLSSNRLQHSRRVNHQSNEQENQLNQYLSHKLIYNEASNNTNFTYHDLLYERKLQKQSISRKLVYEQQNYPPPSRKATPQEIKQIIQKVYYVPEKRDDIDQKSLKQEQELKYCTFHPTTIGFDYNKKIEAPVNGFQKQVERLKKGRQEKQKMKELYQNLGKPKQVKGHSRTPSFIQRDTPKLILEVNIGGGRIQKIKLHGNQDPRLVAKKFIHKHSLQSSMQSVLQDLIDQNIRSL